MEPAQITNQANDAFDQAKNHLVSELSKLRTGRANPQILEDLEVDAYGSKMSLKQVATIIAPEAQLLQITPFDPSNLQSIVVAIRNNQTLGFNPSDDGRVVRVNIPPLTEERRREIAKQIGEKAEDSLVRMRNARHEAFKQIDKIKKDKKIGEDDAKRLEKTIDESLNKIKQEIEKLASSKEQEIMKL